VSLAAQHKRPRRAVRVWDEVPAWYNIVVPLVIAGTIALGSRLRRNAA